MEIKEIHEGNVFSVEFVIARPMRHSHKGKHWPITTQCIIKRNDLVIGLGEVVKHENEIENPYYGRLKAAKKAFNSGKRAMWRELRERLWKQILIK